MKTPRADVQQKKRRLPIDYEAFAHGPFNILQNGESTFINRITKTWETGYVIGQRTTVQ